MLYYFNMRIVHSMTLISDFHTSIIKFCGKNIIVFGFDCRKFIDTLFHKFSFLPV